MDTKDSLLESVNVDVNLSRVLLQLLENKKNALEHFDTIALEDIVPQIEQAVALIEQNQNSRNNILKSMQFNEGNKGLKEYIHSLDNPKAKEEYQEHIQSLEGIISKLQELNTINAKVMKYNSMQVSQRLGELYGNDSCTTYNENADKKSNVSSRVSGKI